MSLADIYRASIPERAVSQEAASLTTRPTPAPKSISASHSERFHAVARDPRLAARPGLRELAMQAAEREPAAISADEIVTTTISTWCREMTLAEQVDLQAAVAAKFSPRPDGPADPFAVADQIGKPDASAGWSKIIATQQNDDLAVSSGGPFPPHPSATISH